MGRGSKRGAVQAVGTIDARLTRGVAQAAVAAGGRDDTLVALLARTELDERLPIATHLAVWEAAMRTTRMPALPFVVGRMVTLKELGVLGYAIYVAATVRDALLRLVRFSEVLNDSGHYRLVLSRERATLVWDRPGPRTLGMRVANEQALVSAATLLEAHAGSLPLLEVRFRHPRPPDITEHERYFRAPLRFGAETDALVLPRAYMDQPSHGSDPLLEQYLVEQLAEVAARVANGDGLVGAVAREILDRLPDGLPSATKIADAIGTSERSLRRRLSEAGFAFSDLIAALQRDRAESLLAAGTPIADVALAIGFADATAFTRAFRRWTGEPPSRWRPDRAS